MNAAPSPPPSPSLVQAAQVRVHAACLQLVADGLIVGSAGNISELVAPGWFVVSPAGRLYESLTPEDYPLVSVADGAVDAMLRPTSELALHRDVYAAAFENVAAIVHTHSRYAAAFAVARIDLPFVCNENIGPASERVLVTPYAAPGTTDLGAHAVATFQRQPGGRAVLLANHGVVAVGASVEQAYTVAAQVEWIAEVTHHASQLRPELPGVVVLPSDVQEIMARNYNFLIAREGDAKPEHRR
jgi:L-fuculose-phosphate aldolase